MVGVGVGSDDGNGAIFKCSCTVVNTFRIIESEGESEAGFADSCKFEGSSKVPTLEGKFCVGICVQEVLDEDQMSCF